MNTVLKGKVTSVFWDRSYAFCTVTEGERRGEEFFIHRSRIVGNRLPCVGDTVTFATVNWHGREIANAVRIATKPTNKALDILSGNGGAR